MAFGGGRKLLLSEIHIIKYLNVEKHSLVFLWQVKAGGKFLPSVYVFLFLIFLLTPTTASSNFVIFYAHFLHFKILS
jgi:hypothetical protein